MPEPFQGRNYADFRGFSAERAVLVGIGGDKSYALSV